MTERRDARLSTTAPDSVSPEGHLAFEALAQRVALCRFGGDCYAYGLLASGHCDLVVEEGLQPYDYMALVCVVEGAGGVVTQIHEEALDILSGGRRLA